MTAFVVRTSLATALSAPRVSIVIAVDTAYVAARASDGEISQGVFMIDNMVRNGSRGEGTMQLTTVCNAGDLIGFHSVPIDVQGSFGDKVVINSFADIKGNVFTGAGHPIKQPPLGNGPRGTFWIGQALEAGTEEYQIQIEVMVGLLQPVTYFLWWNASITAS